MDKPELEPAVTADGIGACVATATCPAPMYFAGGNYVGVYSNIGNNVTMDQEDFGLDMYEPLFFFPLPDWIEMGPYAVQLTFDDESYDQDLFYFCHVRSHGCCLCVVAGRRFMWRRPRV